MPRSKLALLAAEKNLSARLFVIANICSHIQTKFEHPELNPLVKQCQDQLLSSLDDIEVAFGSRKIPLPRVPNLALVK